MAYVNLGKTEDLLKGYEARRGLEGPFVFAGGRVLYYDPVVGSYYDPKTDFYVEQDEMDLLHQYMYDLLAQGAQHG